MARAPKTSSVNCVKMSARWSSAARVATRACKSASLTDWPLTERLAIQLNLSWAGNYRGLADGEFSDKLTDAERMAVIEYLKML